MIPAQAVQKRDELAIAEVARPAAPAQSWHWETHPWLGLCATIFGTILAILFVPEYNDVAGTLMWQAMVMSLGLIVVHVRVLLTSPGSIFHPIPVTAAAPVYWLLLDLIQGTYGLESITQAEVRLAFLAIGFFSSSVWLAGLARPRNIPRLVQEAATVSLNPGTLFGIGVVAFSLAFLRFAIPAEFNLGAMLVPFSEGRWAAPWSGGALGGWDATSRGGRLDHLLRRLGS